MRRDSVSWMLVAVVALMAGVLSPAVSAAHARDLVAASTGVYQSGCPTPRPPVRVETSALGDGRMQVTITAGSGALQLVKFGQMLNATVTVPPSTQQITSNQEVKPPTGATTWTFLIHTDASVQSGGNPRVTVPFTVFDGCGLDQPWQTFAGGGNTALQSTASIADAQITEGNSGNAQLTLTVRLSVPSSQPVSFNFTTVDGTATGGNDFVAAAGTITFNPGETEKTVTVQVRGDFDDESDETFTVTLSNPVNGGIGRGQASVRIVNDDSGPSAQGDTFTASIGSQLSVPAPGLLSNDQQGSQTIQVASFGGLDAGGSVTSNAAGSTVNLGGGGSLTVQANGAFTFTPPAGVSTTFSFRYRMQSLSGQSEATVTINVQAGPAANPDPNYAAVGSTQLSVPEATGVLANDVRGTPQGNVASFGTANATTTTAGNTQNLGNGGSLTVQANGSFTFTAPTTVTGAFTFQYRLTNPAGSSDATVTINVTRGPVITTTSGATTFTEGGGPVSVDPGITKTNPGGGNVDSATVVITNPQQGADETLALSAPVGGITASYAPASHTLTLTGPAPVAAFETALRNVVYNNTNAAPNGTARVIQFQATAGGQTSNTATKSVTISGVNDPPALANLEGGALAYLENDPATAVTAALTVTDADHANLAGATIGITTGCTFPEDVLQFTDQNGITGAYTAATCTLTLTGSSSVANYQTAIRSVTYVNPSNNPSIGPRTLAFQATDGVTGSNVVSRGLNVGAAFDNPVVTTTGGSTAFNEGSPAVTVDGGVTVTDPDSANLASATVTISNLLDAGQETLAVTGISPGITASYVAPNLTLTGADTLANYQAALQAVTYNNTSAAPTTTARTIAFQASDGAGNSNTATKTVTINATNSAPVVTTTGGVTAYTEGDAPVAVDVGLTVNDVDSPNLVSATITITNLQDTGAEILSATGISPSITASYTAPTLTLSGSDTVANYQLALRAISYVNTSNTPTTTPNRSLSFVVNDGVASSASITKDVSVAALNDTPVVTTTGGVTSFTEGLGAVTIDGGVTVIDADNANLVSATVTISNLLDAGQETLAVTGISPSITANYVAPTLTLTGSDTLANYQAALRAITYNNASNAPTTTNRVINFQVNDGTSNSNTANKSVTVTSVNTPPVVTTSVGTTAFIEDGGAVAIDATVTVVDLDNANLQSATVTISNLQDTGLESLTANVGATGITINYAAPTLTLTGPSSVANFEQVLRTVTYDNTSQSPNETTRIINVQAFDGTDQSAIASKNVSVASVNDAPTANNFGAETIGNTVLAVNAAGTNPSPSTPTIVVTGNLLTGAVDVDGPGTLTAALGTATAGATVTVNTDGSFTYSPPAGHVGATDTFTFTVSDGATPTPGSVTRTATITLKGRAWYVKNDAPAGGTGRSNDPFDTIAEAETASLADDYIFIYRGNGTSGGLSTGFAMKTDQKLFGEAHGLIISTADVATLNTVAGPFTLVAANAANRPQLANGDVAAESAAVNINNVTGVIVRGLDLAADQNGVRVSIVTLNSVVDVANVNVTSAGVQGVRVSVGPTRTLELSLADITTSSDHSGFMINGTASAGTTIRQFSNITVSGDTGATAIDIDGVTFDASSAGGIQQVNGGSLTIGSAGNPNNAGGLFLDTVQGNLFFNDLDITTSSGTGLRAFGTGSGLTLGVASGVSNVTTTSGAALDLSSVAATLPFVTLTTDTTSAFRGVRLTNVTGTVSAGAGSSITSNGGTAFEVSGGNVNVTYNGPITATGGSGVSISGNAGTVAFTGVLSLTTGTNAAFSASGGGTVTSNAAASTLTTTTGTALNVSGTSIGAAGLTFRSISANAAPSGIVLANTGSSGGLTVTGNSAGACGGAVAAGPPGAAATTTAPDSADCSGGQIQSTTGPGISLSSTSNVSLTRIWVRNGDNDGIQASNVTNFTLANSLIENNGDAVEEANIDFGDQGDSTPDGLHGTAAITSTTVRGAFQRNVAVRNFGGAALTSLNVTDSQFSNSSGNTQSDDGLFIEASGTANMTVSVTDSYFAGNRGDHFQAAGVNSGTLNVTFRNNTLVGGHGTAVGQDLVINAATGAPGYSGRIDYDIDGNHVTGAVLSAITVTLGTSASGAVFDGFVRNNTIGAAGQALSCSTQGNGIDVNAHGNGTHTTSVTGNTIRRCFDRGISVLANDGGGVLNLTATGNSINDLSDTNGAQGTAREAFIVNAGATSTNVFGGIDNHTVCVNVTSTNGNMVGGAFKSGDIRIRQRFRTRITLPGYGGTPFDTAAVIAFLTGNNPGSTSTATINDDPAATTEGFFGGASCPTPG